MPILLGALASAVRKKFTDNFAGRTNTTGGLGTATDGSQWTAVNGTIQVTSGAATATTTPTSGGAGTTYPMAIVNMPTSDNIIELTGTNEGSGIALWVQSSTDWWMVDVDSTFNTVPGNIYYYISSNNSPISNPIGYSPSSTGPSSTGPSSTGPSSAGPTSYSPGYVGGALYTVTNSSTPGTVTYSIIPPGNPPRSYASSAGPSTAGPATYTLTPGGFTPGSSTAGPSTPGTTTPGTTTPGTVTPGPTTAAGYTAGSANYSSAYNPITYAYSEMLRISKSTASVVNTISSAVISAVSTIKSLRVSISGNTITARAFSDASLVTQLGSDLVYTATGATITTQYGISVSPSAYNQSAIIGTSVKINRP